MGGEKLQEEEISNILSAFEEKNPEINNLNETSQINLANMI